MDLFMKEFTLPLGCSVSSFVIRELRGADELVAAQRADIAGEGKNLNPLAMMGLETQEAQRLSLWMVNGQRVNNPHPYKEMDNWNMRTRRFLVRAFNAVNGCTDEELRDFTLGGVHFDETQTGEVQSGAPGTGVSSGNGNA